MVYKLLKKENKEVEGEVKNIIFDVGQVLVSYDWESYLKSVPLFGRRKSTI